MFLLLRNRPASFLVLFLAVFSWGELYAQQVDPNLRSAYVYRMASYVQWQDVGSQFVIGVLGNPAGGEVTVPTDKKIAGKPVQVKHLSSAAAASQCNLVFVAANKASLLPAVKRTVQGKGILTMASKPGLGQQGVMINLVMAGSRLGFEVNQGALKAGEVKLSSQVMKLASARY